MSGIADQKYLRLLRAMTPEQLREYLQRLERGYVDVKIKRRRKQVLVTMEKHDPLLGNFRITIAPSGNVTGGKVHAISARELIS